MYSCNAISYLLWIFMNWWIKWHAFGLVRKKNQLIKVFFLKRYILGSTKKVGLALMLSDRSRKVFDEICSFKKQ